MLFKVPPGRIKQFLTDMDDLHRRAALESVDDFDGFGVPVAAVEKSGNFNDDISRGDKSRHFS